MNEGDRGGPDPIMAIGEGGKPALIVCPECGTENIQGEDTCSNCMSDLRTLDIPPATWSPGIGPPGPSVEAFCREDPLKLSVATSTRDAIAHLARSGHGCAIVVERGRVVGVFTERDVLNRVSANRNETLDLPIAQLMTRDPVTIHYEESVLVALNAMGVSGFRHIPIVDADGAPRGIISGRDILAYVHDIITGQAQSPET